MERILGETLMRMEPIHSVPATSFPRMFRTTPSTSSSCSPPMSPIKPACGSSTKKKRRLHNTRTESGLLMPPIALVDDETVDFGQFQSLSSEEFFMLGGGASSSEDSLTETEGGGKHSNNSNKRRRVSTTPEKAVGFATVCVREYALASPSTSGSGNMFASNNLCPLTLGWQYSEAEKECTVDSFEQNRPRKGGPVRLSLEERRARLGLSTHSLQHHKQESSLASALDSSSKNHSEKNNDATTAEAPTKKPTATTTTTTTASKRRALFLSQTKNQDAASAGHLLE